jgi:hypothetical protein
MSSPSIASLPADVVEYLRQLEDADRRMEELTNNLSETQATWQSSNGASWSVAQCLEHIAEANRTYLDAMHAALPKARVGHTPFRTGGWLSAYFLKQIGPQVTLKMKAPKKIKPRAHVSKDEALSEYRRASENTRRFVVETAQLDLCGVRFKNPYVPLLSFTIATALLIMIAHTQRHLNQAEQIVKNTAFPR